MLRNSFIMIIAFILFINCNLIKPKAAVSYPPAVEYKSTNTPFTAREVTSPIQFQNGYRVVTYISSTGQLPNSYIIYDSLGKVVFQKSDDTSVGDHLSVSVVNHNIVVFGSSRVKVMDIKGNVIWSKNLIDSQVFASESGDLFIQEFQTGNISKLDINSGANLWTYHLTTDSKDIHMSNYDPKSGNLLVVTDSNSINAINNGNLNWTIDAPTDSEIESLKVSQNGTFAAVLSTENTKWLNVYSSDGKLVWEYNLGNVDSNTIFFDPNNHVYVFDVQKQSFKFFSETGKQTISFTIGGRVTDNPIMIGSNMYVLCSSKDSKGNTVQNILNYDLKGHLLAQTPLTGTATIVPNGLYLMADDHGTVAIKFYKFGAYQNPVGYYQVQYTPIQPTGKVGYNLSTDVEGVKTWMVMNKLGIIGKHGYARYNTATGKAVRKFQKKKGLRVTGVVDVNTWVKLGFNRNTWYSIDSYIAPMQVQASEGRQAHIEAMINQAYKYLGNPYIVGAASSPDYGVDCSGLVTQAFYAAGLNPLPVSSIQHAQPGNEYNSRKLWATSSLKTVPLSERQRGDLIFYYRPGTKIIIHVAIYLGNNKIIEAWPPRVMVSQMTNSHDQVIAGVKRPFQ